VGDSQSISLYVYNGSHPTIICFLSLTSHFTENTASINYKDPTRRWIINYVCVHAECLLFLSDFNRNRNVFTNITKNASNEISAKVVRCESLCSTRTDWQRHTTRLTAFRNCFASELTNHNTKQTCHKQGTWMYLIITRWALCRYQSAHCNHTCRTPFWYSQYHAPHATTTAQSN